MGTVEKLDLGTARLSEAARIAEMSRRWIEQGLAWRYRPHSIARQIRDPETAVVAARAAIEEVAAETGADADGIVARGGYARNCWVQGGEGDWLIEHVANLGSHRGGGLVQALIARALADGKAAGYSRASISFVIGNHAAERCYTKAGFAFAEEKRDAAFEALTGAPGFRRFARGM